MPSHSDNYFHQILSVVALSSLTILTVMIVILTWKTIPAYLKLGSYLFFGTGWNAVYEKQIYGLLPYALGTLVTSGIALLVAVPISLGVAIFLSEMAPRILRTSLTFVIELLAVVPSVIYGFWGLIVFGRFVRFNIEVPLSTYLGSFSVFKGTPGGQDLLTAGLVLAIMIIPTISSVSREVMRAVPYTQREAAYSLGATKWETVRLGVLSYARSGILGACILGLGRAMGETMAVAMTIGGATGPSAVPSSLLNTGQTLASLIALNFGAADPTTVELNALMGAALMLLIFSLLVNMLSALLVRRVLRVKGGALE